MREELSNLYFDGANAVEGKEESESRTTFASPRNFSCLFAFASSKEKKIKFHFAMV